jgi:hypothetical protein
MAIGGFEPPILEDQDPFPRGPQHGRIHVEPHHVGASEVLFEEPVLDLFGRQPHEAERMRMMRSGRP